MRTSWASAGEGASSRPAAAKGTIRAAVRDFLMVFSQADHVRFAPGRHGFRPCLPGVFDRARLDQVRGGARTNREARGDRAPTARGVWALWAAAR